MEHTTAYHGSTLANCTSIIKDRAFKVSTSRETLFQSILSGKNTYQWLGDGVYFWPNNRSFAKYWAECVAKKSGGIPCVIRVKLIYDEERCFDLRLKEHRKVVLEIIANLVENFHDII